VSLEQFEGKTRQPLQSNPAEWPTGPAGYAGWVFTKLVFKYVIILVGEKKVVTQTMD